MASNDLNAIAKAMVTPGRGILAADESTGTIGRRFDSINVENVEENRRAYRDMLFSTKGIGDHISGVILYDETLRQKSANGTLFSEMLTKLGVLPGIKVDAGAKDMVLCPGEQVTEGLDGLVKRCTEYVKLGAKFAKWRAVINIGAGIPSSACLTANAHALARYAAICQATGLVPIVEPEVIMDGDHSIERCEEVTERALHETFAALVSQRVRFEEMVLKPSMVISGKDCAKQAGVQEVAQRTLDVLKRWVPAAVPGIAFLSGGQSDEEATAHLDSENEALVQEALGSALKNRTSIVIAHRLSTVRAADQILVLDGGLIRERGRHEELIALDGLYADLYSRQAFSV